MSGVDGNTLLMMHCDDLTDSSPSNLTPTVIGSVPLSDTAKWGKSLQLSGGAQGLSFDVGAEFNLGADDFTIDWWEYRTAAAQYTGCAVDIPQGADFGLLVATPYTNNKLVVMASSLASQWDLLANWEMGTVQAGQWAHRALVRHGNTFYAFQNGALYNSISGKSGALVLGGGKVYIGRRANGSSMSGYLDEVRISNVARWTEGFTPPVRPYSVPVAAPSSISYGTAEAGKTLSVSWTASIDPDGGAATYTLEQSTDGGTTWEQVATGGSNNHYTAAVPTGKPTICYRVKASDGTEESGYCTGAVIGILQDYQGLIVGGGTI